MFCQWYFQLDSILDSKTPPYRILHSTPSSEIHYTVSVANSREEIDKEWKWIQEKLLPALQGFEGEDDVTEYVKCVSRTDAEEQKNRRRRANI